ncbi:hypothetical protein ACLOJK_012191 [Asimina triloba]
MSESGRFQLGTIGALSLSVVSSVSIVICNKALISSLRFNFELLHGAKDGRASSSPWASCHCFWSVIVARGLCSHHFLKDFHFRQMNDSCGRGVEHQSPSKANCLHGQAMTKLAIIPCTVLLETLFFRKKFSRSIQLSLTVLLLGVGIATVTDMQLNVLGSVLSLLAVLTTCIAQILPDSVAWPILIGNGNLVSSSKCAPNVLGPNEHIGTIQPLPTSAVEHIKTSLALETAEVFIVLSCLISVSVNFSTFLVIGKTSPVTYQVLGHLKTCLVLTFGYVLLRDPFNWRNIFGILIALIGMILYSYLCSLENQQKASEASVQLSQCTPPDAVAGADLSTLACIRWALVDDLGHIRQVEPQGAPDAKEVEADPLLAVENGTGVVADVPKGPAWSSDKDLHA